MYMYCFLVSFIICANYVCFISLNVFVCKGRCISVMGVVVFTLLIRFLSSLCISFFQCMYVSDGISRWRRTKTFFSCNPSSSPPLRTLIFFLSFPFFFIFSSTISSFSFNILSSCFYFPFCIFYFTFALYWVWEECYAWELSNDHISIIELCLAYSVQCSKKILRIGSRKLYITRYYSVQPINLHIKRNFNHLICLAVD